MEECAEIVSNVEGSAVVPVEAGESSRAELQADQIIEKIDASGTGVLLNYYNAVLDTNGVTSFASLENVIQEGELG